MTPAKVIARLRRLAADWSREEARLCEQFGDMVVPQSMRARQIKDTQAIDAAIEMIDRLEAAEKSDAESLAMYRRARDERDALRAALRHEADCVEAAKTEIDALRARIEAMVRQEPVAWARKLGLDVPSFGCVTDLKYRPSNIPESSYIPLYTLPGAQGESE